MSAEPPELPEVGTRVSLRYLAPPGAEKPMTDVVGRLVSAGSRVQVLDKDGELHELRRSDVLYVRRLTDRPVKNSAIRSVEHAAALGWPGREHRWLDGWLLRAGGGAADTSLRANSAVPLDMFVQTSTIPAIIDWYADRGLVPRLAVPERLLRLPERLGAECETRTLVADVAPDAGGEGVALAGEPDTDWLACYGRDVGVEVLTAVAGGGLLVFASLGAVAVGRAAVTDGPDGTRWLGLTALRVAQGHRGRGHGRAVCAALQSWGRRQGATRRYVQVRSDDTAAFGFCTAIGFTAQHHSRYLDARVLA